MLDDSITSQRNAVFGGVGRNDEYDWPEPLLQDARIARVGLEHQRRANARLRELGVLQCTTVAQHRHAQRTRRLDTFDGGLVLKDRKSTRLNSSHVKISYAVF